jgi:hypothetical protein
MYVCMNVCRIKITSLHLTYPSATTFGRSRSIIVSGRVKPDISLIGLGVGSGIHQEPLSTLKNEGRMQRRAWMVEIANLPTYNSSTFNVNLHVLLCLLFPIPQLVTSNTASLILKLLPVVRFASEHLG